MKKILLSCFAATLLFTACKKDDDNNTTKDRTTLLTTGKWQMTGNITQVTTVGTTQTVADDYANMDACEKDNYQLFKTDKTIVEDEGATKCNSSDPQQSNAGTWSLMNTDTKLRVTDGTSEDFDIEQLDDNTLKISQSETQTVAGVTFTYKTTISFKHYN